MEKCQWNELKKLMVSTLPATRHHSIKLNHSRSFFPCFPWNPTMVWIVGDHFHTSCNVNFAFLWRYTLLWTFTKNTILLTYFVRSTFFFLTLFHLILIRIEAFFLPSTHLVHKKSVRSITYKSKQMFAKYITLLLCFFYVTHLGPFFTLSRLHLDSVFSTAIFIANVTIRFFAILLLLIFWDQFLCAELRNCAGSFYHSNVISSAKSWFSNLKLFFIPFTLKNQLNLWLRNGSNFQMKS